jgi:aspartate 1-decarboxylase
LPSTIQIDGILLEAAGIHAFEQIQIYNISNGNRFTTYAIRGKDNSGVISVNGAAAHTNAIVFGLNQPMIYQSRIVR